MILTPAIIDMNDQQPQWGCPYCSRVFSKAGLKKHLELDKQIIFDYLSKLQKALIPNCHQFQDATDSLIASEEENDVDVNSTKRLKCPNSDCQTNQTYSKKYHLLRHFKTHVACNAKCECGQTFNYVDQFEKHLERDCVIMQDKARGIAGIDQKHRQNLGLRKVLISSAKESLDQQIQRSQKHGLSDDAMGSSSNYETFSTRLPVGKRKRNRQSIFEFKKPRLSTNGTRCHSSDQEGSMMEDAISPEAPFNSAFQQRPLGDAGSILSYTGAIKGVQADLHITENNLEATQAFGNPISRLHHNQSHDLTQNAHGISPAALGSDIVTTVVQYSTEPEWSHFNGCSRDTSQNQWQSLEQYHWDEASAHGDGKKWGSNDWSSFGGPASNI